MTSLLDISTTVAPADLFTIDGEEFKLLGMDNLSEADETRIMSLVARYGVLANKLLSTVNKDKSEKIAGRMRELRVEVLAMMTDVPVEILKKVPPAGQVAIFQEVTKKQSMTAQAAGSDEDLEDGDEPDIDD